MKKFWKRFSKNSFCKKKLRFAKAFMFGDYKQLILSMAIVIAFSFVFYIVLRVILRVFVEVLK